MFRKSKSTWKLSLLVKLPWIFKFRYHVKTKRCWKWRASHRFRNGATAYYWDVSSRGGKFYSAKYFEKHEKVYKKIYCQFSRDTMKIYVNFYSRWAVLFLVGREVIPWETSESSLSLSWKRKSKKVTSMPK